MIGGPTNVAHIGICRLLIAFLLLVAPVGQLVALIGSLMALIEWH